MPLPNEHSARLRNPGDYKEKPDWSKKGKFRRTSDGTLYGKIKVPETIDVIWGQLKSQSGKAADPESLRFPTKGWTAAAAKKWLKDNKVKYIRFEPAQPKKKEGASLCEIPREAFYFDAGTFQLADPDRADDARVPIKMLARSGQPIVHWYWGKIVHDLSGVRHKARVPIDYRHNPDQGIGYLDRFDTKTGDLWVEGALVPYGQDDKAQELIHRSQHGVPYEASIFWGGDGIKLEEIDAKSKAKVNGYEIEGPAVIVREWPLRGVAVCLYGADANTRSEFNEQGEDITVSLTGATTMSDEELVDKAGEIEGLELEINEDAYVSTGVVERLANVFAGIFRRQEVEEPAKKAEQDAEAAQKDCDQERELHGPTGQDFLKAFGEKGGVWFAEGKSWEEAQRLFVEAVKAENAGLKKKLGAVDRGEKDAAEFQVDPVDWPGSKRTKQLADNLGGRRARMTALMAQYMPRSSRN